MTHPTEIQHPTFGTLRLHFDGGSYLNYRGEVQLTPKHRVAIEFEHLPDEKTLAEGLEAARQGFERFRQQEPENRLRTAELLLPEIHDFFSEDYTADTVAGLLSVVQVYLNSDGLGTAHYDSGGTFKEGTIAASFDEDGTVYEVDDLH
jgi:hypothetical protein